MRVSVEWALALLVVASGCDPRIPEGRFACRVDGDCPEGWHCNAGHCFSTVQRQDAGHDHDAGHDQDAGLDQDAGFDPGTCPTDPNEPNDTSDQATATASDINGCGAHFVSFSGTAAGPADTDYFVVTGDDGCVGDANTWDLTGLSGEPTTVFCVFAACGTGTSPDAFSCVSGTRQDGNATTPGCCGSIDLPPSLTVTCQTGAGTLVYYVPVVYETEPVCSSYSATLRHQ